MISVFSVFGFISAYAEVIHPRQFLKPGMQLTYSANGSSQQPWEILNLEIDIAHVGMSGCTKVSIEYAKDEVEESWECISNNYLHTFESNRWWASRPIGPNMRLEIKSNSGKVKSIYETKDYGISEIGGAEYKVLKTIIVNLNEDGSIKNRITENFSIGLGTATEGVFEVPDTSYETGWRSINHFKLITISK